MQPLRSAILLIVAMMIGLAAIPSPVQGDAKSPSGNIELGDWWKYSTQTTLATGLTLSGTITLTVADTRTVLVTGVSTESFVISTSGSGTVAGGPITGTWTTTGNALLRKSDFASLSTNITVNVVAGVTLTETLQTTYSVPVPTYQFPLSTGESWSTSYNLTVRTTTSTSLDPTPKITTNTTRITENAYVTTQTANSVPAGTFEAYVIHKTYVTSNGTTSSDDYYSPQAQNSIRGQSEGTTEQLLDFRTWAYTDTVAATRAGGGNYVVQIRSDVKISNPASNGTAITFQVSGPSGVTGRAEITLPRQLNTTITRIYLDGVLSSAIVYRNSTGFTFRLSFGLSDHTLIVVYANPLSSNTPTTPTSVPPGLSIIWILALAGAAVLAVAVVLAIRLSRKPHPEQTPTEPPFPPPETIPPAPSPTSTVREH